MCPTFLSRAVTADVIWPQRFRLWTLARRRGLNL